MKDIHSQYLGNSGHFWTISEELLVVLRMISFGFDYHWRNQDSHFDMEKHCKRCHICKSGNSCYQALQESRLQDDKFAYTTYLCYLLYAPLYIAGPILSFKAFASQAESSLGKFVFREISAVAGAITITCLMVANLVGFVIGPKGINWLLDSFLSKEGLPVLGAMFITFYVGTKLMFHIEEARKRSR
ncbi:hypothetical protein PIB30_029153 [Stylosanthes scabra]|uniref:Uncharacterized protein n=1 Tax=Stylosanthes scabra TaxID=79078 RepID=A0ABU6X8V9_9FABA|nr:hypothetical protein [Stylosanthes scabra]